MGDVLIVSRWFVVLEASGHQACPRGVLDAERRAPASAFRVCNLRVGGGFASSRVPDGTDAAGAGTPAGAAAGGHDALESDARFKSIHTGSFTADFRV